MDERSKITEPKLKHSKLGLASVLIGACNILILIYCIHLFIQWLLSNPELMKNPVEISGTPIADRVMDLIMLFLGLQLTGFFVGILGLLQKERKKLLPLIGIILNGLFLLLTLPKIL